MFLGTLLLSPAQYLNSLLATQRRFLTIAQLSIVIVTRGRSAHQPSPAQPSPARWPSAIVSYKLWNVWAEASLSLITTATRRRLIFVPAVTRQQKQHGQVSIYQSTRPPLMSTGSKSYKPKADNEHQHSCLSWRHWLEWTGTPWTQIEWLSSLIAERYNLHFLTLTITIFVGRFGGKNLIWLAKNV